MSKQVKKKKTYVTRERQEEIDKKRSLFFIVIAAGLFFLIFLAAIFRTLGIEITHEFQSTNLQSYASKMYTKVTEIQATRGQIYDSKGNPLAVNIKTYDMYIVLDKKQVEIGGAKGYLQPKDRDAAADIIINNLGYKDNKEASDLIRTQLNQDPSVYKQVELGIYGKGISIEEKEAIEKECEDQDITGIKFTENVERYYPFGDFASYVLGYVLKDDSGNEIGQIGVESLLNGYLKGKNGEERSLSDNNNIPINQDQTSVMDKSDGADVELTIDSQVQSYIQSYMQKYLKGIHSQMAFTVVMDAKTGGILGAYSEPSFDPNKRDVKNYLNPYTDFCYEPGSTIKSFVIAAAMETGNWHPDRLENSGKRSNDDWGKDSYVADWIYNEYGTSWGPITWEQGYWFSANTVMTHIEDEIGNKEWDKYLTDIFKFGTSVDSEYMKTSACTVNPKYPLDYANTAFGQGMTVNVMQLLRAYTAFTDDGTMIEPHIVKSMKDPDTGEVFYSDKKDSSLKGKKVVSAETAKKVREEMEQAVYYAPENLPPIYDGVGAAYGEGKTRVGAKTGTAQVASGTGYAKDGDYIYSVMDFAPIDDPQIVLYTAIVAPKESPSEAQGKYVTGIVDNTINYLNGTTGDVDLKKLDNNRYQLYDYKNKDVNEVAKKMKSDGIKVITTGEGKILSQYPSSSQIISKDETVILRGQGSFKPSDLEGKTYNEAYGICQAMEWKCNLSGMGTVTKVTNTSNDEYTVILTPPNKLTSTEDKESKNAKN